MNIRSVISMFSALGLTALTACTSLSGKQRSGCAQPNEGLYDYELDTGDGYASVFVGEDGHIREVMVRIGSKILPWSFVRDECLEGDCSYADNRETSPEPHTFEGKIPKAIQAALAPGKAVYKSNVESLSLEHPRQYNVLGGEPAKKALAAIIELRKTPGWTTSSEQNRCR